MYNWENKVIDSIHKNINIIVIITISFLAIWLRLSVSPFVSTDYTYFLEPWFRELQQNGQIAALGLIIGNYNIPYMFIMAVLTYLPLEPLYSIKAVSIFFDFVLAFAASRIVHNFYYKNKKKIGFLDVLTYSVVLFLPTVFMNSSLWGQCDSIYASFVLLFILFAVKEKYFKAFLFLGFAFSFKLQTIFILPAIIIYYMISRKFSFKYFLLIPLVMFFTALPAIVAGRPIDNVFGIYFAQAQSIDQLSNNYPNLPQFFNGLDVGAFTPVFIALTFAVLIIGASILFYKNIRFKPIDLIYISTWSIFVCVVFLPDMHDRYGYVLEVLSVVLAILTSKQWYLAVGVNFIAMFCYFPFLFKNMPINIYYLSIAFIVLFLLFSYKSLRNIHILKPCSSDPEKV